jgi:centrosomal protein CEP76
LTLSLIFFYYEGSECKVPAGILQACLQILPMLEESVREDILNAQLGLEYSRNTERERLFLVYAKQWWKEYLEIRDDHKQRLVKIFAQVSLIFIKSLVFFFLLFFHIKDENGVNRPVSSYVRPMRTARLIDTPRQAARFVSLIGYNKLAPTLGVNEQVEQWLHLHTFIAKNRGVSFWI